MIWRIAMLTMQVGLLAMLGLAFWRGPSNAPIFDAAQRMPAPEMSASEAAGGSATDLAAAGGQVGGYGVLFEVKEYHLAMARDWLVAAGVAETPKNIEFAERAAVHAQQALMEGPANGYAWTFLAWAEHLAGHDDKAKAALAMSWRWTPNSSNIALTRAVLASRWWPELEPPDRERVLADMLAAYADDKLAVRAAMAADERLDAIWRLARAYKARIKAATRESAGG